MRHLRRVDPHLRAIIDRIGPCRLEPHPDRFSALVRSIISQQISTKAAASINRTARRDWAASPTSRRRLIEIGEASLRTVGLSSAKARYVLNLAEAVASGQVPLDQFDDSWDDQAITQALTAIKGIGVWTAEMFLIFALNRPDILPASDLGVRVGLARPPRAGRAAQAARLPRPGRNMAARTAPSPVGTSGREPTRRSPARRCRPRSDGREASRQKRRPITMTFDLILKGGWVIDGSGGPAVPRRRGLDRYDDRRGRHGSKGRKPSRVVDVTGRYVVPGFIDAHVHGDLMLLADPIHLPALRQGVTTYLIGQDGSSFAPASPATLDYMRRYTAGFNGNPPGLSYDWRTVGEYLARFDRTRGDQRGLSDPQRQHPDGGHGAGPSTRPRR